MKFLIVMFMLFTSKVFSGEPCYLSSYDLKLDFINKCPEEIFLRPNDRKMNSISSREKVNFITGSCSSEEDKRLEKLSYFGASGVSKISYTKKSLELTFPNCHKKKKRKTMYTYDEKRFVYRFDSPVDLIGFYIDGFVDVKNFKDLTSDHINFRSFTFEDVNYLKKIKIKENPLSSDSTYLNKFIQKQDRCKIANYKELTFVGCGGINLIPGPETILIMNGMNFLHRVKGPEHENAEIHPLLSFKYRGVEYLAFKSSETAMVGVTLIAKYKSKYFSIGYLREKCSFDNYVENGYCETLIPQK